jgi:hypothetical protein
MFDDLHDPNPPDADMATLAAVSSRAKAIRQRRMALTGSLAAGVIAVVGVTVVLTRDDDPGSISITENPTATEAPVVTGPGQTDPPDTAGTGQTDPAVVPSTDPSTTSASTPPADCPSVGLSYVGAGVSAALINEPTYVGTETTDDPGPIHAERGIEVDEGGTAIFFGRFFGPPVDESDAVKSAGVVTLPRQSTPVDVSIGVRSDDTDRAQCILDSAVYDLDLDLLEAQGERQVTAIDGNGDAVVLSWNGQPTVLHDGTDPDDPPPLEGESTAVDGVAVDFWGREAWIGICCEPVAGTMLRTDIDTVATYDDRAGFGHSPVLSPDDRYLAAIDYLGVQIRHLETGDTIVVDLQSEVYQQAMHLAWAGAETLVVQLSTESTSEIVEYRIIDGAAVESGRSPVAVGTSGYVPLVQLVGAGVAQGAPVESAAVVWLWSREDALASAYPTNSIGGSLGDAVRTVDIPGDATVVSIVGTEVRWVDESRILWTMPLDGSAPAEPLGEDFIWVR